MKKLKAQIAVALVCVLLGFLLAYQFKLISKNEKPENVVGEGNKSEVIAQIDQLKLDIEDIQKKNEELSGAIKKYEDLATSADNSTKYVRSELDNARIALGLMDVQGPGVTISLSPKSSFFSQSDPSAFIRDIELLSIVNELRFRGAEAISINGKRVTSRSGIKSSSNNSYILINDEKVSPQDTIEIRAIGQRTKFSGMEDFIKELNYKEIHFGMLEGYAVKTDEGNTIKISAYNKSYVSTYTSSNQ